MLRTGHPGSLNFAAGGGGYATAGYIRRFKAASMSQRSETSVEEVAHQVERRRAALRRDDSAAMNPTSM